jgi:flagellar biosynthesis/type III secretory pathway protein FliH
VREALDLAAGSPQVQLRMNPADHQALKSQIETIVQEFSRLSQVNVVADASIGPGGCRLETQHGVIDQRIEAQLARIEAELA